MIRIVSLVPSSTETLVALGADVVACSRFCEQPQLAHVGGTKNPDVDAIVRLAPDLVVLDREENRIEDHDALIAAGLTVFVSDVTDLDGAIKVVTDLASAAGVVQPRGAPDLDLDLDLDLDVDLDLDLDVEIQVSSRRTAFVPIWRRPWMTISSATYGASLLDRLGVDLVPVADAAQYPTVDLGEIAASSPDLVVVPSEPYEFEPGHLVELAESIAGARVVEVSGQDLFWWGIRTPSAIRRLAAALAPHPMH